MYKVFINDKLLCFVKKLPPIENKSDYMVCETMHTGELANLIRGFKVDDAVNTLYVINNYIYNSHDINKRLLPFPIIQAAGGLVQNKKGEFLFIYRFGRWDLPKGLAEHGESMEQTAVREVKEETGVNNLKILDFLTTTHHLVGKGNDFFIKEIFWYKMKTDFIDVTVPQTDESIIKAEWFNKKQIDEIIIPSTYKTIIEVLNYC